MSKFYSKISISDDLIPASEGGGRTIFWDKGRRIICWYNKNLLVMSARLSRTKGDETVVHSNVRSAS